MRLKNGSEFYFGTSVSELSKFLKESEDGT